MIALTNSQKITPILYQSALGTWEINKTMSLMKYLYHLIALEAQGWSSEMLKKWEMNSNSVRLGLILKLDGTWTISKINKPVKSGQNRNTSAFGNYKKKEKRVSI